MKFNIRIICRAFAVAIGLAMAMLVSIHFRRYLFPPPPNYAIALLGALAVVIVVVLPREPSKGQKVAWIAAAFGLMFLEMWAVSNDRKQQNSNFQAIVDGLKGSIDQSQIQFRATMQEAEQIMQTTQQVGQLAQKNLENLTGGNSFAYVAPQNFSGDQFPGVVWNHGDQPLTGVTLTIAHTTDPIPIWGAAFFKPILIGTIGPHDHAPIPNFVFQPRAAMDSKEDNYWIMLSAQNGTVSQSIYFRRDKRNPEQWADSFIVSKDTVLHKAQGQIPKGATIQKLLLYRSWSDQPSPTKH